MCRRIEIAKKPKTPRIYVSKDNQINHGPVMTGDKVTVNVEDDITFEIKVKEINGSDIYGTIVAIGTNSKNGMGNMETRRVCSSR
jgi:hypothetical protein